MNSLLQTSSLKETKTMHFRERYSTDQAFVLVLMISIYIFVAIKSVL